MTTIEKLFEHYLEEKNEEHEKGAVLDAITSYRRELRKVARLESRIQSNLWDEMVLYGDAREKDGFIAGFQMCMRLFDEAREGNRSAGKSKAVEAEE